MVAQLKVLKKTTLTEVKEWFSTNFSLLKIEFYAKSHKDGELNGADSPLNESEFVNLDKDVMITIQDDYSIGLVEYLFKKNLDLNVQVFRRNGDVWIQTSVSDNWTIAEQTERAEFHLKQA